MNKRFTLFGVVALVALTTGVAQAQDEAEKPYTVRIGLSQYTDSDVRNFASSTGYLFGVSYNLPGASSLLKDTPGKTSVDLVILGASGKGNRVTSTGLLYTVRIPSNKETMQGMYYGGGIGFVNTKPTGVSAKTNLGLQFLVGTTLSSKLHAELGYHLNGSVSGTKVDALSLSVGMGF